MPSKFNQALIFANGGRFAGYPETSLPHIKKRAEKLFLRFNNALSNQPITLEGTFDFRDKGNPLLTWEFGQENSIQLKFESELPHKLHGKEVIVQGTKKGAIYPKKHHYLEVTDFQEKKFDWKEELKEYATDYRGIDTFFSYFPRETRINPASMKSFILSVGGSHPINQKGGIGLATFNPNTTDFSELSKLKKMYEKIDPFQGKNTRYNFPNRYTKIGNADTSTVNLAFRNESNIEQDWILNTDPNQAELAASAIINTKADFNILIGEENFQAVEINKEGIPDIRLQLFVGNKCLLPEFTTEAIEEIPKAGIRIEHAIEKITPIDREVIQTISAKNIFNSADAYARANLIEKITAKDIKTVEEMIMEGIKNTVSNKAVSEKLEQMTKNLIQKTKTQFGSIKYDEPAQTILLLLYAQQMTKQELYTKLCHTNEIDMPLYEKIMNQLYINGRIYEPRTGTWAITEK